MVSTNRTHRTQLARALAAVAGISYQAALARVVRAAEAGTLPDPLDPAGMRHALDLLLAGTDQADTVTASPAAVPPPHYHQLAQIFADRMQPGVRERVARADALGVTAVRYREAMTRSNSSARSPMTPTTRTSTPTGGIASSPRLVVLLVVEAPTVSTHGALPGAVMPPYCASPVTRSRPRLPAAVTTTMPESTARFAASVSGSAL